jgi:flagellar biosynthesis protein FlhF
MNIKRFFGKNSREALNMVRKALGEDAVIISNKSTAGGTEIMAVSEEDMQTMANESAIIERKPSKKAKPSEEEMPAFNSDDEDTFEDANAFEDAPTLLSLISQNKSRVTPAAPKKEESPSKPYVPTTTRQSEAVQGITSAQHQELNEKINMMLSEMRGMRNRMETQLSTLTWNQQLQSNPIKAKVISTMLAANFSPALSRQLVARLPNNLDLNGSLSWVKNILSRNLTTLKDESEILNEGGIFALVGPTGVGKTTTTAKLAARYVMKHGTQNLGLITTDGYRVGGHEQLRIYGKILGVMVYAVKDEADLKIALNELKNKHTILIDTVGVSQRDQMVTQQIAMLKKAPVEIKKLLCLNATSSGETLSDVIKAYKGRALDGCIITKVDEAASVGNALDVVIREKLKLYYTTNGQRVPEDIHLANRDNLISRALNLSTSSWPYQHLDEELPSVLANANNFITKATEVNHV